MCEYCVTQAQGIPIQFIQMKTQNDMKSTSQSSGGQHPITINPPVDAYINNATSVEGFLLVQVDGQADASMAYEQTFLLSDPYTVPDQPSEALTLTLSDLGTEGIDLLNQLWIWRETVDGDTFLRGQVIDPALELNPEPPVDLFINDEWQGLALIFEDGGGGIVIIGTLDGTGDPG